jgi:hypothetical protein
MPADSQRMVAWSVCSSSWAARIAANGLRQMFPLHTNSIDATRGGIGGLRSARPRTNHQASFNGRFAAIASGCVSVRCSRESTNEAAGGRESFGPPCVW